MNHVSRSIFFTLLLLFTLALTSFAAENSEEADIKKTLIAASGGASDALSNSLPALVLTAGTEVDFISFDLVSTRDNQLVVYHDIDLGPGTDVAEKFPEHARKDGRFLSIDFTLDEIRLLRRTENSDFAAPTNISLGIATLKEYLALHLHLEKQFNKKIGLAPNLVDPGFHRDEGIDISILCLQSLTTFGYNQGESALLLQSMDADELQRIKKEVLPRFGLDVPLLQRIGIPPVEMETDIKPLQTYDQTWIFTRLGARMISSYISGVVLDTSLLHDPTGNPLNTEFLENIRALAIPVYGSINDIGEPLPIFAESREALYDFYFTSLGLDGLLTNSYKEVSTFLINKKEAARTNILPLFPLKPLP